MRKCCICGTHMHEGYLHEEIDRTYCSEDCLHQHITAEEYDEAYKEGTCFWTSWINEGE